MSDPDHDQKPVIVRVSRRFEASAERVFDAWLDPAIAGRWLFATPSGRMLRVDIDARVGGGFVIVEAREDGEVEHVGEYFELERPHRLVFTFSVPKYSSDADRVSLDIVPDGDGCVLTLTHEMAPHNREWAAQTQQGWTQILEGLSRSL